MKKYRLFGVISAACVILSILYSFIGVSQTSTPRVQLTTNPPLEKIHAFEAQTTRHQDPVKLTLQALDTKGKPLNNALLNLELFTPKRNPFFTTDFPIVEGTQLLNIQAVAPNGKLEVEQMLPIRGKYELRVNATPSVANSFTPYKKTLNLNAIENSFKFQYLAVVAGILLGVGLLGGWVIGGQSEPQQGEIAPYKVRLLLSGLIVVAIASLLFINISAEVADAHGGEQHSEKILPASLKAENLQVRLQGDKQATVGKLANYAVQVTDNAGQPVKDVAFQVKAIALEDDLTMFAYKSIPDANGKLTWQEQFFDGAPHKIVVEVTPGVGSSRQFQPLKVEQEVDVKGIAPPIYIRLISLFYFSGTVGIGMAIGLWLQQNRVQRPV